MTLKKANPDFPILIRECSGVQPKLWARFGKRGVPAGKHQLRTARSERQSPAICSKWGVQQIQ